MRLTFEDLSLNPDNAARGSRSVADGAMYRRNYVDSPITSSSFTLRADVLDTFIDRGYLDAGCVTLPRRIHVNGYPRRL